MTSSDVRDVLNIPDGGAGGPRPAKKIKTGAPRASLKGLAREVQNLGGDNPIAIVPEMANFKKRRLANRKPAARWVLKPFVNSAREDNGALVLRHWRRDTGDRRGGEDKRKDENKTDGEGGEGDAKDQADTKEEPEDSSFAKFNVKVSVPQYSDDQYAKELQSDDWTRQETDYLMEMVRDFDIRWPVIWDRYEYHPSVVSGSPPPDGNDSKAVVPAPKQRTMEDLKRRYYEVAAKMMTAQKPVSYMTKDEYELYERMTKFDGESERRRKAFAASALTRSKEEAREEESLLLELKRIYLRNEKFNEERRELYHRLEYPSTETDISSFKSTVGLQSLLNNLLAADKSKKRKSLMGAEGVSPQVANPAAAAAAAAAAATEVSHGGHSRRESLNVSVAGSTTGATNQTPTSATGKKGSISAAHHQERRKLTEAEERIYGVSHHERLSSGPTFRTEKINKLFNHKSNSHHQRVMNTFAELDVQQRLVMPTSKVTTVYEQLLAAVNSLLDARKIADKLDAEIKLERAKKAERERLAAPAPPPALETIPEKDGAGDAPHPSTSEAPPAEDMDTDVPVPPADGTRGAHKRSASVLSAVSDKSVKRLKK